MLSLVLKCIYLLYSIAYCIGGRRLFVCQKEYQTKYIVDNSKLILKSQLVILVTCTCLLRILKGLWKRSIFQVRSTPFFCLLF